MLYIRKYIIPSRICLCLPCQPPASVPYFYHAATLCFFLNLQWAIFLSRSHGLFFFVWNTSFCFLNLDYTILSFVLSLSIKYYLQAHFLPSPKLDYFSLLYKIFMFSLQLCDSYCTC